MNDADSDISVPVLQCDSRFDNRQNNITSVLQPERRAGDSSLAHLEGRVGDSSSVQLERRSGDGSSSQPVITLTDIRDAGPGLERRIGEGLYSHLERRVGVSPYSQPERRIGDSSSVQLERRSGESLSPQPMITLTDMSDAGPGVHRRDQILYSDDFDAIHDYLLNTDSPMLAMSPSWLCRDHPDSTAVFPAPVTAVNQSIKRVNSSVTSAVNTDTCTQSAVTSHSSTIDMSRSIGSSTLHGHKVCVHVFVPALIVVLLI